MKTTAQKSGARTLATIMAIVIAAIFTLSFTSPVFADDDTDPIQYTTAYYYSDSPSTAWQIEGILNSGSFDNVYSYSYDSAWQSGGYFEKFLAETYKAGFFHSIYNSVFIFEFRYGLSETIVGTYNGSPVYIVDILHAIFKQLKLNNNKIMFICDTDEGFLCKSQNVYAQNNLNKFLDYVDFHINTDVLSLIYTTVIKNIYLSYSRDDFEYPPNYDYDCTTAIVVNQCETNIVPRQMLYFLARFFGIDYRNYDILSLPIRIAQVSSTHIIVEINGSYYDGKSGALATNMADLYNALTFFGDEYRVYALGDTRTDDIEDWLNFVYDYTETVVDPYYNDLIPQDPPAAPYSVLTYLYNENNTDLTDLDVDDYYYLYSNCNNVKLRCGGELVYSYYDFDIYNMISDFISGYDISGYDNYYGRCDVTYKTLGTGDDGWIDCMSSYSAIGYADYCLYSHDYLEDIDNLWLLLIY